MCVVVAGENGDVGNRAVEGLGHSAYDSYMGSPDMIEKETEKKS